MKPEDIKRIANMGPWSIGSAPFALYDDDGRMVCGLVGDVMPTMGEAQAMASAPELARMVEVLQEQIETARMYAMQPDFDDERDR